MSYLFAFLAALAPLASYKWRENLFLHHRQLAATEGKPVPGWAGFVGRTVAWTVLGFITAVVLVVTA